MDLWIRKKKVGQLSEDERRMPYAVPKHPADGYSVCSYCARKYPPGWVICNPLPDRLDF